MDRPDEGPPAKARRLSSSEPSQDDAPPPPPPPPPPPLMRLPLPPPEQRPRLREETEAAQVLADMRGVGLGPTLPPPPPYVILEEGGVRAYFTLGAGCSYWDPEFESGYGEAPPPAESLETFSPEEVAGGSLEIDIQVTEPEPEPEPEPSGFSGEAIDTCSIGGREYQVLAGLQGKEEAIIIVEDDEEEVKENVRKKRRRRRRKQRKVKKQSREVNPEKIQYVLQALESIQLDLEAVNIKAGKAFLRLKRKFIQMRRPFLERRDLIIQHIPGFWVKAFLNHPKISVLISPRDEDIFRYLTNLQVQDLRHISMGYKMKLYFKTNPYFTNMVIVKEFQCNRSGRLVSHSTPIRWHRGQEPQAHKERNQDTNYSFFSWFSNHSLPEADRIAEIIKNDLWVNPVRYYMMGEGGYRANRKKQEKKERFSHIKKNRYELVIMDDFDDYQLMQDIIGETSDSDFITDNETVHDIKISDFMETTDCFETTDNEITDFSESFCDSESVYDCESPDRHLTTENNDSADEHTYGGENSKGGGCGNNLDSSDSDYGDNETSDDEDNDGNEGDNEGSDDDGNEGDNEGSDDDDRDIDYYENAIAEPQKNQLKISNLGYYEDEVENIFEEESSMEEEDEEGSEEEDEDSDEEEGSEEEEEEDEEEEGIEEDWEDSDVEEVLQVQNAWANPRKRGKTG